MLSEKVLCSYILGKTSKHEDLHVISKQVSEVKFVKISDLDFITEIEFHAEKLIFHFHFEKVTIISKSILKFHF